MEEEILCSSLPDSTDSVLQQPQQDSWSSIDHQYINGEKEAIVWDETEVQLNQAHGTDLLNLTLEAGQETPKEAEQWEQLLWPICHMTGTGAPLSFATVQWDMPHPFTEMPSLMTDRSSANELDSGGVMTLDPTSLLLHQSEYDNAELLVLQGREEQDEFDSCLNLEGTGNGSEPCDSADAQEPATQEEEDSTHELVDINNEIPVRTDSEEKDGYSVTSHPFETVDLIDTLEEIEGSEEEGRQSVTSNPVDTVDLIHTLEEIEGSEDETETSEDLKPEEEREEPGIQLTGQADSEDWQTSSNGLQTEEENEDGGEEEEELCLKKILCTEESQEAELVSDVEISAEAPPTDDTGIILCPDQLIHLQQSDLLEEGRQSRTVKDIVILKQLNEDFTGQSEEQEMYKDVDHSMEQSEAVDNDQSNEEASIQEAENAERIESSQEIPELTEELEETSSLEQQDFDQTTQEREASPQSTHSESMVEMTEEPEQIQAEVPHQLEEQHSEVSEELGQSQHLEQSPQMELTEQSIQSENAEQIEESAQSEQTVCAETEDPEVAEQREQTEQTEHNEQNSDESEITEQLSPEPEVTQQSAEAELNQVGMQAKVLHQPGEVGGSEAGDIQTVIANGEQPKPPETSVPQVNGGEVEREMACCLAERLYKLDGIQRVDVVKHLDKDNDFSRAVGEEYLKFFDFTGQTLDHALRSFLKVVILIGESQERERVLQHFASHFHQCNPDSFSSSGAVLALTCALMLLNTDLHGQHVGKSMSSSKFVSNLDEMNEGENFSKDLLKSLYNSIKSEPLQWAVDEEELKSSVLPDEDVGDDAPLRSKANPFQDVPHDKKASVVKEGFLQRKILADIDGKRTPWGKRGWKTYFGVLRGMVLYLQKDNYKRDQQTSEEVVSVHHCLAEQAVDYTKKPHVFRLQTADWRVFLFQAPSKVEMNSWICRVNLVSALHSSPPFPAAVGSQRKFCRPILPASQSAQTLERQLQSHGGMLASFKADLSHMQQNPPECKKARAKELEEHRVRADYLQYEMCRYEIYIQVLEGWKSMEKTGNNALSNTDLNLLDKAMCVDSVGEEEEEEARLKKSHSSPSLELEIAPPAVIKVRRNISERRTYRRTVVPRWNKEA